MQHSGDAAAVADIARRLTESDGLNQQLAAYITQLEAERYRHAQTPYELDCSAQTGQEHEWQSESRAAEWEDEAVKTETWDGISSSPIPPQLSPMDLFLNAELAASIALYRRGPGGSERRPPTAATGSAPPERHA